MVEGGVADVLVSNEVVGAPKLARLAELSRRAQASAFASTTPTTCAPIAATGAQLDVYIEIDVGMRRCGVAPGAPARRAGARDRASTGPALRRPAGLPRPRAAHALAWRSATRVIETAAQHVQHTKRLLDEAGIACPIVTGAGSGTFMFEVEAGAWDEIQPGSYAFMDADYAKQRMGRAAAALRARALRAEPR